MRSSRLILTMVALSVCVAGTVHAQTPPLVFTVTAPSPDTNSVSEARTSASVAERALLLWKGAESDFGLAVDALQDRWMVHSVTSIRTLSTSDGPRPTFQQVEALRSFAVGHAVALAVGGGVREEWDGTQVLIGRALAGVDVHGGRLEGSAVIERAFSSATRRDAADLITTLAWSRPVTPHLAVGVEGIGQDLEGFWDPNEVDGGARLLVGPSLRVQSRRGNWAASATAGPVFQSVNTRAAAATASGRRVGFFVSASWTPRHRRPATSDQD